MWPRWKYQFAFTVLLVLLEQSDERCRNANTALFVALRNEPEISSRFNAELVTLEINRVPRQRGHSPVAESRKQVHLKQELLVHVTCAEERLQFVLFVNLDIIIRSLRPIAFLHLDSGTCISQRHEGHDEAFVNRLLVQALFSAHSHEANDVVSRDGGDIVLPDL